MAHKRVLSDLVCRAACLYCVQFLTQLSRWNVIVGRAGNLDELCSVGSIRQSAAVCYAVQLFGRPESEKIVFRLLNKTEAEFKYQIGGEPFTLPPLYARKHTLCRPSKLEWLPDMKSDAEKQKPREIKPADGDEFQVQTEENTIQLELVETLERSSPGTM